MNKLFFPFLLLLALTAAPLKAQAAAQPAATGSSTIEGKVVGGDGQPLAGVEVILVDLRRRVETAADGTFRFEALPAGSFLLEVEGPAGAATHRVSVEAGGRAELTLALELVHHSDEVVVTGGLVRSQLELAQATNILHDEDLAFRMQATLGETLAQQPGISSTSFGAGASRPVIRGLGGDRVRMLQGGIDSGDVSSTSPDHAVTAEPMLSERIEVLRGPSTLLYGSSAIGGVVNVIDGSIPEEQPGVPVTGHAELNGGSAAEEKAGAVVLEGGSGSWVWAASGLYRDAGDYDIPGLAELEHEGEEPEEHEEHEEVRGTLPNSDLETRTVNLGVSRFFGGSGYAGVSYSAYDSEYGIPAGHDHEGEEHEGEGEEHGEEGGVRIDMQRRRFDLRAEITRQVGPFQGMRFRFGSVDYEHAELEGAAREVGTTFYNDQVEGRIELVQAVRGPFSGSLGLQVASRDLEAIGEEAFIPPVGSDSFALFTFQEVARLEGRLRFQLGARFERQENDVKVAELEDRSFDGFSGSLGLVFQPNEDFAFAASLASSTKLPNGEELYAFGPHFATRVFEVGDVGLGKEQSLGLDLALRKTSGRLKGELSFFYNQFSDFIFQDFTGEEEDGLAVVRNIQADADFYGAELSARALLLDAGDNHLDLIFGGDLVRAELDRGGYLPRIPPSRLNLGLHFHRAAWHFYGEVWEVAEQDRVAENETPTAGYTQVNAGADYRFIHGNRVYDFILRCRNLTDEEIRNHVSYLKDQVPLPGRDFSLSVRFTF
jgi:iron complex outermembrane receptor protein